MRDLKADLKYISELCPVNTFVARESLNRAIAAEARLQQAEADNAALLGGLKLCEKLTAHAVEVGGLLEGVHDDTWLKIQELNATNDEISDLINADHPGAALLKELEALRSGLERIQDYALEFQSLNTDMKEIADMAREALADLGKERTV